MLELVFIILAVLVATGFLLVVIAPKNLHNQIWFYVGIALIPLVFFALYLFIGQPSLLLEQQQQIAQQKSNQTVIEALHTKLEKSPDDYEGWLMLARSYQALEQPDLALKAYEKAIDLDASDLDLLWSAGEIAQQQANFALAHKFWTRLYQQLPADSDAAINLESILNALDRELKELKN